MAEILLSLGLDVGTTSTQMIFSQLVIENKAGSFAVPEMTIQERKILYKSPIHFTPLLLGDLVDAEKLKEIVDLEYRNAGISKSQVDTGAIIITGETSRKENARAVLEALSDYAGDFVVATAGPDLESILAARGSGAVEYSRKTGKNVLHMDIGGGTSNLALIEDGKITATGCLNVGGRLLKISADEKIQYVSPVLEGLFSRETGDYVNQTEVENLAGTLVQALEMAAGLREPTPLLAKLTTREAGTFPPPRDAVISFSGGAADCIETRHPWLAFGDIGPELGQAIKASRLCAGEYVLGTETIRATVIGAGCHSAQLSGSTVFYQNMTFPLKNLPVVQNTAGLKSLDGPGVLALPGPKNPGYWELTQLAASILSQAPSEPLILVLEADAAKALGQLLALHLGPEAKILCIDRVRLPEGSFLDVGIPVGPALPVVVKTLILSGSGN